MRSIECRVYESLVIESLRNREKDCITLEEGYCGLNDKVSS